MRVLVPLLLLTALLAVPPTQAIECPGATVGDRIDCWYEKATGIGGAVLDEVTDIVDEPWMLFDEPLRFAVYCLLNLDDPSCWT